MMQFVVIDIPERPEYQKHSGKKLFLGIFFEINYPWSKVNGAEAEWGAQ